MNCKGSVLRLIEKCLTNKIQSNNLNMHKKPGAHTGAEGKI
jgi:hypothetical protein